MAKCECSACRSDFFFCLLIRTMPEFFCRAPQCEIQFVVMSQPLQQRWRACDESCCCNCCPTGFLISKAGNQMFPRGTIRPAACELSADSCFCRSAAPWPKSKTRECFLMLLHSPGVWWN